MSDHPKNSVSSFSPAFVIALFDEDEPTGTTVHVFADPDLWTWIHHLEEFPDGVEAIDVPIPGTALFAYVTCWEPVLDKAQHLVSMPGTGSRPHPSLTDQCLGRSDSPEFQAAFAELCAEAGHDRCFVGQW